MLTINTYNTSSDETLCHMIYNGITDNVYIRTLVLVPY